MNKSPQQGITTQVLDLGNTNQLAFNISIFEVKNGLVNLTKMARHFGKEVKDWTRLEQSKRFIASYTSVHPEEQIFHIQKGGNGEQGTFGNRRIALKFAEWISVDFEIFANEVLDNYFTPKNPKPTKQLSTLDILELATNEIKKLKAGLDYKNQIVIERSESVPPEKMRLTINRVVRDYAFNKKIYHQNVWSSLYKDFKYKFNIDLVLRAKNSKKPKIQIAENLGQLENLYNLALKMFELEKINQN